MTSACSSAPKITDPEGGGGDGASQDPARVLQAEEERTRQLANRCIYVCATGWEEWVGRKGVFKFGVVWWSGVRGRHTYRICLSI